MACCKKQDKGEEDSDSPFIGSYRLGLSILGFLVFLHGNMQRVSISVAILCMVNHTAVRMLREGEEGAVNLTQVLNLTTLPPGPDNVTSLAGQEGGSCLEAGESGAMQNIEDGPFVWDKTTQGHILGAYFYGYLVGNFPAGVLAEKYGPKWVLLSFYSVATVATLLTPIASWVSPVFLIILRILIGIGTGALFPCMHVMWSRWAPPMERSRLAGITHAGCMAAAMVGLPLSGVLCKYGFGQGWDSIFYVIGSSSAIMILLWVVLSSNSPSENNRVSSREKRYIVTSLKGQMSDKVDKGPFPWRAVLKAGPFWAIVAANFCSDWGLYTLLTNIPTFLSEVLQFQIESSGLFSALPFIGLWINMNVSPVIADKLRSSGVLTTTATRKIFNTIGMVSPAVFLCALGFIECTQAYLGVALLTIGVTLSGCAYTGFLVNHMDIAPMYAGTLLGITNSLGSMSGFIAPAVAAALTQNQSREEWQIVFFVSGGVYLLGAVIYFIFASGSMQPWARQIEPEVMELKNGHVIDEDDVIKSEKEKLALEV